MTAELSASQLPASNWVLTLYVNGASPRSAEAIVAVRRLCDADLAGMVDLAVINAADHPALVKRDNILALPTLVRHLPAPLRHLVGSLTDMERVRTALDLGPSQPDGAPDLTEGWTPR